LGMTQLHIIEDILQWSNTDTHHEEMVIALGLCLYSNHSKVVEKACASLEEIKAANKQALLTKAAILNLTSKDPSVKRKAALFVLQNDFYYSQAWQSI